MKPLFAMVMLLPLTGCLVGDPPCKTQEGARKAAAYFEQCIQTNQQGEGGVFCGEVAYATFCRGEGL
jgi:hypothetical protein